MKIFSIGLMAFALVILAVVAFPQKRQTRQIGICLQQCESDGDCKVGRCVFNGCGRVCKPRIISYSSGGSTGSRYPSRNGQDYQPPYYSSQF
jgi:hypothetical protein